MNNKLDLKMRLPFSLCDDTSHLSVMNTVYLFMDLATENGDDMGMGRKDLDPKGLFWVASKTKIIFDRKPALLEEVTASTWPEAPGRIRCNRYYAITKGEEVLVRGKTEWAVIDAAASRPHKLELVYPKDMEYIDSNICPEPFYRLDTGFDDCEVIKEYIVPSTDIDSSQHMNNVAYIRAALGCFSCEELRKMKIKELEAAYRTQCYEREKLTLKLRKEDKTIDIGVIKADGKTGAVVRLVCE